MAMQMIYIHLNTLERLPLPHTSLTNELFQLYQQKTKTLFVFSFYTVIFFKSKRSKIEEAERWMHREGTERV